LIKYIIPSVANTLKLERHCPYCNRFGGNIHSGIRYRRINDTKITAIAQRRIKCPFCKTTWTIRPDGIRDGQQRSSRLISLGILLYMLGLSCRNAEKFLRCLDCRNSKSSIERDVAEAGKNAKTLHCNAPRMRVRVLGVDGTGARMAGRNAGLLFFVDIDRGKLISVEPVNERDTNRVRKHVCAVMSATGAEQLRTDELHVYEGIVPEGFHTICLAHWRKSKARRANEICRQLKAEGMQFESEDMVRLLRLLKLEPRQPALPEDVEKLVRRYINCHKGTLWKANQLLQHIERTREQVGSGDGDRTNNTTERLIGLDYKIMVRSMRGIKAESKALGHCYLSEYLRGENGVCDLRKVV